MREELTFSIFKCLSSIESKPVRIDEIIRLIKYDNFVESNTRLYREMAVKVSLKTAKQEVKQKIMPAFSVGVLFKGIGKQLKDVDHATGFARSEDIPGAHAKHYNAHSIGVCYEGGLDEKGHPADTRTKAQKFTLLALLTSLKADYPEAKILGHRDLPWVKKECPCFNAQVEYKDL